MNLPLSPFVRLERLLQIESSSEQVKTLALHIGEPQTPTVNVMNMIHSHKEGFYKYPPVEGTIAYRNAVREWLKARYKIEKTGDIAILPTGGSREALFQIALACKVFSVAQEGSNKSVILLPEPFYHVYAGTAGLLGMKIYPLPLREESDFMPDFDAVPTEILQETLCAYICSPNNPTGAVMTHKQLADIANLAREHHFTVISDECYSEIYRATPPASMLEVVKSDVGLLHHVWVVNSLSKRSGVPGLRLGFVASHPDLINSLKTVRQYAAAQVPLPILAAGVELWQDETHVESHRHYYNKLFSISKQVLEDNQKQTKINIPEGGMFLWLNVGNGEECAKQLWQQYHIKVMPGRYMCHFDEDNFVSHQDLTTTGDPYIRIAIVHEEAILRPALEKIAHFLLTNNG